MNRRADKAFGFCNHLAFKHAVADIDDGAGWRANMLRQGQNKLCWNARVFYGFE